MHPKYLFFLLPPSPPSSRDAFKASLPLQLTLAAVGVVVGILMLFAAVREASKTINDCSHSLFLATSMLRSSLGLEGHALLTYLLTYLLTWASKVTRGQRS